MLRLTQNKATRHGTKKLPLTEIPGSEAADIQSPPLDVLCCAALLSDPLGYKLP
jgi:hypothetical protein